MMEGTVSAFMLVSHSVCLVLFLSSCYQITMTTFTLEGTVSVFMLVSHSLYLHVGKLHGNVRFGRRPVIGGVSRDVTS